MSLQLESGLLFKHYEIQSSGQHTEVTASVKTVDMQDLLIQLA